jgi:hypothetical protein
LPDKYEGLAELGAPAKQWLTRLGKTASRTPWEVKRIKPHSSVAEFPFNLSLWEKNVNGELEMRDEEPR